MKSISSSKNSKLIYMVGFHFLFLSIPLHASVVSDKIANLVKQITDTYEAKNETEEKAIVAVLPLNASENLAQRNVGFAFSELITHHLSTTNTFRLVERSQILDVLEEQKLQQSGAIEMQSAVQMGRLLGAEYILLGSVESLAGDYNVNGRLVSVETGELIATGFESFPKNLFEDQAKPYLSVLPQSQVIGFYVLYNHGFESSGGVSTFRTAPPNQSDVVLSLDDFNLDMFGGGIKYFPHQSIFLDFGFMLPKPKVLGQSTETSIAFSYTYPGEISLQSGFIGRALIGYLHPLHEKFNLQSQVGAQWYDFRSLSGAAHYNTELESLGLLTRVGLEFRPQQRFGLGLFANYFFGDTDVIVTKTTLTAPSDVTVLELNPLSIEANVAIYF